MKQRKLHRPVSGLDLLKRLDDGTSDPVRLVIHSLDTIRDLDPQILAMAAVLDEGRAITAAQAARGPLRGLPVVVKDVFDTHDLPTAYGSPIYDGHRPASDAAIVTMLRRQGAVVIGKAATCEFAYMNPTSTRNPADPTRTAGGSSSGSAAAVAAGMTPFAIGTQTGGSTIRPASYCGIAGFKPSLGLLPTVGLKYFAWSIDTVGLFAAGVRDVAYLAQALADRQPAIEDTNPQPRFGVPETYPWGESSVAATQSIDTAIRAIEQAGGTVHPVRFDRWMAQLIEAHETLQSYQAFRALGFEYDHHRELLSPVLRSFLDRAASVTSHDYQSAALLLANARERSPELFRDVDVLLTPSATDEAPDGFASTGDSSFNRNWTLLGNPCVSVPGMYGPRGGPIGVQVIGRLDDDARCLAAAVFVEDALRKYQ
jgi:Asp-tRNA(Asn)/Glu-tRNA(Gln) amidotransferase A subunit family amidase